VKVTNQYNRELGNLGVLRAGWLRKRSKTLDFLKGEESTLGDRGKAQILVIKEKKSEGEGRSGWGIRIKLLILELGRGFFAEEGRMGKSQHEVSVKWNVTQLVVKESGDRGRYIMFLMKGRHQKKSKRKGGLSKGRDSLS